MAKSLIEALPHIASEGRRTAQSIIERLSIGTRIGLQTNELVLPRKDVSGIFHGQQPSIPNEFNAALDGGTWMNRLIYGDNLLAINADVTKPLETHRREMRESLTTHLYEMSNMMSRNKGVWLSSGWVKAFLWVSVPCLIYTIITIVYFVASCFGK